jgi:hypothetical protein
MRVISCRSIGGRPCRARDFQRQTRVAKALLAENLLLDKNCCSCAALAGDVLISTLLLFSGSVSWHKLFRSNGRRFATHTAIKDLKAVELLTKS